MSLKKKIQVTISFRKTLIFNLEG